MHKLVNNDVSIDQYYSFIECVSADSNALSRTPNSKAARVAQGRLLRVEPEGDQATSAHHDGGCSRASSFYVSQLADGDL
jgi:hypothetical protein